jgi:hypothetical protein
MRVTPLVMLTVYPFVFSLVFKMHGGAGFIGSKLMEGFFAGKGNSGRPKMAG